MKEDTRGGTYSMHRGMRNAYKILAKKPKMKRTFERTCRRWVDNIEIDLKEIGCKCVDWIYVTQNRDQWWAAVNTVLTRFSKRRGNS
jgi:hypothetical protein